jgi:hypothetical protein
MGRRWAEEKETGKKEEEALLIEGVVWIHLPTPRAIACPPDLQAV